MDNSLNSLSEQSLVSNKSRLLNKGMLAVMTAQFFSALGDNALLFITLALLIQQHYPDWSQPVMQMLFVATYILLAPFVGQVADSFAKGRVMIFGNSFKLIGALVICAGGNPFLGYTLVGAGAAIYSPAKYGILGELTDDEQLVQANGLMESSTITAILLGALLGGVLADFNIPFALWFCVAIYGVAVVANLLIPRLQAVHPAQSWQPKSVCLAFLLTCRTLWQDGQSRFSLLGTSLFWGAGVTLRFLLVIWIPVALGISNTTTLTALNAVVAIGIAVGAGAAARFVTLQSVWRTLPAGILMGLTVVIFSWQTALVPSVLLLILIGILGGFFVVPLNALLQERGRQTIGAGNAIAVQNLGENSAMLMMLGLYALAVKAGVPAVTLGILFGGLFTLTIMVLAMTFLWGKRQTVRHLRASTDPD